MMEAVSTSVLMGRYLTFINNNKANPVTGTMPDENYARQILQLSTIGLYELNPNGTLKIANGKPIETYEQADIMGLARVFTGWRLDGAYNDHESVRRPMSQFAQWHETGAKSFLDTTIPAGTDGVTSLGLALDAIFAHPNVPPFISKQLIQRLVTSNPSPAYVGRVAAKFTNDGKGVRGNLKEVIRAILLDDEARTLPTNNASGKLREPVLRFIHWARASGAASPSGR